ncbi:MAG: hypothetical protein U1F77_00720 [Kiritimatiellia bacterium]
MGTGTKISYVVGILAVIGMVIYNKVKKAEAAARPPAPAPHAQPAAPRPPAAKPPVAPAEIVVPPPKSAPAAKGRNKEMTEEERNRLNESFAKLDDEKHREQKENFEKRLARAKTGSKTAQLDVGTMYMKGTGVTPDRKLAREWLDKSAAQNHPEAFLALGELDAIEGDTAKAVKQYVHAGDLVVPDFQKGESRAKEVVARRWNNSRCWAPRRSATSWRERPPNATSRNRRRRRAWTRRRPPRRPRRLPHRRRPGRCRRFPIRRRPRPRFRIRPRPIRRSPIRRSPNFPSHRPRRSLC